MMADEIRGGNVPPGPPDPGFDLFYYRNYNNDATDLVSCSLTPSQPIMSITECGFTEQDGYRFKEWNTAATGSATSYSVGDTAPNTSLFAIWEEAIDDICVSYKGSNIVTMSASGTKTLETEGKYCEDDITITYIKPSVSPNIQSLTVTTNGTYTATSGVDGYSPVVVNVSGGSSTPVKKQINFIDYDGTLLYSYTKSEINAMTSESDLPANPSHTGLTAQGWNWTLAQIKAKLTSAPDGDVWVGQMYATESGDTEIDIQLHAPRLSPYLGIAVNGTVEVDWGDGTTKSTVTGTSLTTQIKTLHTYADEDPHTISIHKVSGSYAPCGSNTYGILSGGYLIVNNNKVYANSVKNVRIGNSVTSIGNNAFYYCCSLASVTIPNSVTSIGNNAFYYCCSLASMTIPNGVTNIGNNAFQTCYSLASVTIPSSVTSIGGNAFYNCASLTSMTIPNSVTSIGSNVFGYCYSLASVTISNSVTSIDATTFYYCYSLASMTIPNGVTNIGNNAFQSCCSLTSVTIPNSVTSIGNNAFYYCYSLASMTIPNGVTNIGNNAFYNCYSLASVTIPSSVTSIGGNAFYNCTGLGSIHFKSSTPPTVSNSNTWSSVPTDCKIYVPSGKLSDYTGASNYPSSSTYTYVEE